MEETPEHLPARRKSPEKVRFVKKLYVTGPENRMLELAAALSRKSLSSWMAEVLIEAAKNLLSPKQ